MHLFLTEGLCGADSAQTSAQSGPQAVNVEPALGSLNGKSLSRSVSYVFPISSQSAETMSQWWWQMLLTLCEHQTQVYFLLY